MDSRGYIISEILALLYNTKKLIYFKWFRGHIVIAENELVDTLTKEAAQNQKGFHHPSSLSQQPI